MDDGDDVGWSESKESDHTADLDTFKNIRKMRSLRNKMGGELFKTIQGTIQLVRSAYDIQSFGFGPNSSENELYNNRILVAEGHGPSVIV